MEIEETAGAEGFVVSQGPHTRSKENIVILAGSGADRVLTAGMVLGKRVTGTAAAVAGSNTGNGTMGTITVSGTAKPGRHILTVIEPAANGGVFTIEDPDGETLPDGAIAAAYSAGGLAFTLADGATDFVAGDQFFITVSPTAVKYVQHNPDATTGEQVAAGILRDDVTAPDGEDAVAVAIVRDAEVNQDELVWPAGIDAAELAQATRELNELGIILRDAV